MKIFSQSVIMILVFFGMIPWVAQARDDIIIYDATGDPGIAPQVAQIQSAGVPLQIRHTSPATCRHTKRQAPSGSIALCVDELPSGELAETVSCRNCRTLIRLSPAGLQTDELACRQIVAALIATTRRYDYLDGKSVCVEHAAVSP